MKLTTAESSAQRQLVAEFMADKQCISAWKNCRSVLLLVELSKADTERLFNLLFDLGFAVKAERLGTWQYYVEAAQPQIESLLIDTALFDEITTILTNWK